MLRMDSKLFTLFTFVFSGFVVACGPEGTGLENGEEVSESSESITAYAGSSTPLELLPISTGVASNGLHYFVDNDTLTRNPGFTRIPARGIFAMSGDQADGFLGLFKCNFADNKVPLLTLDTAGCHKGRVTGKRVQPKLLGFFAKQAVGEFNRPLYLLRKGNQSRVTANANELSTLFAKGFTLVRRDPAQDAIGYVVCIGVQCLNGSTNTSDYEAGSTSTNTCTSDNEY